VVEEFQRRPSKIIIRVQIGRARPWDTYHEAFQVDVATQKPSRCLGLQNRHRVNFRAPHLTQKSRELSNAAGMRIGMPTEQAPVRIVDKKVFLDEAGVFELQFVAWLTYAAYLRPVVHPEFPKLTDVRLWTPAFSRSPNLAGIAIDLA